MMTNHKIKLCFVVVVGIPGSGKTHFIENYIRQNKDSSFKIIHVCYDDLIPLEEQRKITLTLQNEQSNKEWKNKRSIIKSAVFRVIEETLMRKNNCLSIKDDENSFYYKTIKDKFTSSEDIEANNSFIVFIDDNNYYRSMRYEYFKFARQNEFGFVTLWMKVTTDKAIYRNNHYRHNSIIPSQVIEQMSQKLEIPNYHENKWEKFSLCIDQEEKNLEEENYRTLDGMINQSISSPFEKSIYEDESSLKERENDKLICSKNVIHSADKILRKKLNQIIKENRGGKDDLKKLGQRMNEVKNNILKDLKSGALCINSQEDDDEFKTRIELMFDMKLKTPIP